MHALLRCMNPSCKPAQAVFDYICMQRQSSQLLASDLDGQSNLADMYSQMQVLTVLAATLYLLAADLQRLQAGSSYRSILKVQGRP